MISCRTLRLAAMTGSAEIPGAAHVSDEGRADAIAPWPTRGLRLWRRLGTEYSVVAVLSTWLVAVLLLVPARELAQDTWLMLVGGRYVVQHGIPHVNTFTSWAHGERWIDQQWLAQVFFYGIWRLGGVKLALLVNAALLTVAFALPAVIARRRGSSPLAVALATTAGLAAAGGIGVLRAQVLAMPLFVALYALLSARSNRASRLLLAIPLLALWANVHGSVVLGAVLVILRATIGWREGTRLGRAVNLALAAGAALAVFLSPYGLDLVRYYRLMLVDAPFARFTTEWQPTALSARTFLFFLVLGAMLWLLGRSGGRLVLFERLTLPLLALAALHAERNGVWFGLAVAVSGGRLLDGSGRFRRDAGRSAGRWIALAAGAVAAVAFIVVSARPSSWFESRWPADVADVTAAAAARHPGLPVFSENRFADWLMWRHPALEGRVAYDTRFELLSTEQLKAVDETALTSCRAAILVVRTSRNESRQDRRRCPQARVLVADENAQVLLIGSRTSP
jgi:hypothetical protein